MPLRDHFRPPVWNQASWEGFHGGWPMMMVLNLAPKLPKGFAAEPRVHLGIYFEIDVCTFDKNGERNRRSDPESDPSMSSDPPPNYAATCRKRQAGRKTKLDTWALPLVVGQSLSPLYIWLTETLFVSLDLEAAYEQTCRALQIG
jgi:hypothetical protein